jgi:hypothetical protein
MRNLIVAVSVAAACLASMSANAAEETKVSGKAFIDFTNIDKSTNGVKADGSGFGVDITRFYVGIDHAFDDMWSANITTDLQYASAISATEVYIKKAYVQAKVSDAFVLRLGSADLPWVPFVDGLYGYRYFEKVMTDRTGFGTSADWGLHASGKFADGMVNYAVSAVNGKGYKDPSRSKTMDLESRISVVPVKGLTIGVGFRSGKLGAETETNPAENTASRTDAVVAYVNDKFRVGAEYFTAKNYSAALVQSPTTTDKADGTSVWGSVSFTNMVAGFARYEDVKPNKTTNTFAENKYTTLGVSFTPRKNIDLAVAYKQTKADASATSSTKTNEIGVWSQVNF